MRIGYEISQRRASGHRKASVGKHDQYTAVPLQPIHTRAMLTLFSVRDPYHLPCSPG